ncbi:type II toxin-antitoxin system HipA family toxin [uncultured Christiangramia sp.]|uniref:type II toxin-antitoxin system HipA family toxin n=1 Tax=Christiangramia sp. 3-2217-3z TaxID=3417564 RepID=UPI00260CBF77|nr:type II toxin-antitoxin system HipA family toxin [uncultured Christiangramia sp.]
MPVNDIIQLILFKEQVGKIGYDPDQKKCFFQYNPVFLEKNIYKNIFPYLIKRIESTQVFTDFSGQTFKGLPPAIADSLPDTFGNIIFKEWFDARHSERSKFTPLEQLTYVANRGMGALEYQPAKQIPKTSTINISEMVELLRKVLDQKKDISEKNLDTESLLNIFKMGTSAGGARPKLLISEHKENGAIIPGDIEFSDSYYHYLVKLSMDENANYNKETVEYIYSQMACATGIDMMPSHMIDQKHFATHRYDRQNGQKQHVLTASGLTGWDFRKPEESTYENLFKLALDLKVPYKNINQLYRRMIFNLVFANIDDHLKNHSFIYEREKDSWSLSPAYDLTFPLDLRFNFTKVSRALSINGKRELINKKDVLALADSFSVKNPKGIIEEVQEQVLSWEALALEQELPRKVIKEISNEFQTFI